MRQYAYKGGLAGMANDSSRNLAHEDKYFRTSPSTKHFDVSKHRSLIVYDMLGHDIFKKVRLRLDRDCKDHICSVHDHLGDGTYSFLEVQPLLLIQCLLLGFLLQISRFGVFATHNYSLLNSNLLTIS